MTNVFQWKEVDQNELMETKLMCVWKMMISWEDIVEIQDKLRRKKKEHLDVKKSLVSANQKQEEMAKKKKKLKNEQKKLAVEKDALSNKRKNTNDKMKKIKSLEDSLNRYDEASRDLITKLDLGQEIANRNLIAFLTKSIEEIKDKLKRKKKEYLDVDKNLISVNQKQEELDKEKKKLEEEQKKLEVEKKALSDRRKKTTDEIKSLEESLNRYVEATKDLVTKLDLGSEIANSNLIAFLTKSIEEKEAALACPVCLETATTPIFMCLQQHLVCSSCKPRVTSCPECREAYQVNTGLSLDNTDHVT